MRLSLLLGLLLLPPTGAAAPQRIVSLNVCTDQLVMLLVPPERIAAVSFLAADPQTSVMVTAARQLHTVRAHAEQVLALQPDLVVAGTYAARPAVSMLRRLGQSVLELAPASSVEHIMRNLRVLGDAVAEPRRAADLIAAMRARLQRLETSATQRPLFINYNLNGYTSGSGTLLADLAHRAGFDVASDRLQFSGMRAVSLEQLIGLAPQFIDLGRRWDDPPAMASQSLQHPALKAVVANATRLDLDERYWSCGLPASLDVVAALVAARTGTQQP